jgi:hypothetical protein
MDEDYILLLSEIEHLKKCKKNKATLQEIKKILSTVLFVLDVDKINGQELSVPMLQLISILLNENLIIEKE